MTGTPPPDATAMWNARYGDDLYLYGTDPNDFVAEQVADLAAGNVLCVADGEGRNGVYLAGLGHRVTSMDVSDTGMAKARALAEARGVDLQTVVADLGAYDLGTGHWDLVVSVFAHTPPAVRRRFHAALATALTPGGRLVLEAYTPAQIGRGTGGPPVPELTMDLARLRDELTGLELVHQAELVRPVLEGTGHTGDGAVVQVVAVRPA